MAVTLDELTVADPPQSWAALGFDVDVDVCVVGDVRIRLAGSEAGRGLAGWSLRGAEGVELDGLATTRSDREPPPPPAHPNKITGLDHVVAITPALERTVAALERAGLDLRRIREEPTPAGAPRQAFFRLGATILEVAQEPDEAIQRGGGPDRPAFFWGLAFAAPDLDATVAGLGDRVSEIRPAVQPGRRIATLRRSDGLANRCAASYDPAMQIDGTPLDRPAAPLAELLRVGLEAGPEEIALESATRSRSWRALEEESARLAGGYRDLGLEPGDRIASLMPNRIDLVVHYLACFKAGLIATPLNYRYTHREIDHALAVSGARALLAHVERAEDVAESSLASGLELGTIGYGDGEAAGEGWAHDFAALLRHDPLPPQPPADPAGPAAIFFTSGSTGPAKGVTHTDESLRWMVASAAAAFELEAGDVFLPGSSMSHIGSFLWTLATLSVGGRVVVARTTDAHELLPLLREHQPTVLAMIPAALSALIHDHELRPDDFASLRLCRAGADKVSTELLHEFAALAGFPIVEGYGMSEVGLATLNPPSGVVKQGSIGLPIGGFSIAVRDEAGEPAGTETVGRVWIRTRSRMAGYWEAPEATEEVVVDDWLDSGDLARADADGYLWFFGRKKQVIVHDGSNISPYEVEGALVEHPAIALAGAVGIHDTVHGENVRAYVTLEEGAEQPSRADLIAYCRERVGYKAPEEIVFLDEMPLNPTGKIDRVGLKKMAEDHLHPHGLG